MVTVVVDVEAVAMMAVTVMVVVKIRGCLWQ